MQLRLELHEVLCDILGSRNVYFQPPATIQMKFPCIIYALNGINIEYADNYSYNKRDCYSITYVDTNADSLIPNKILELELSAFQKYYIMNNLHHFIYIIYF